jgi:hypothetical protein
MFGEAPARNDYLLVPTALLSWSSILVSTKKRRMSMDLIFGLTVGDAQAVVLSHSIGVGWSEGIPFHR